MGHLESEAERWERGCKQDKVRNRFVVPRLAQQLDRYKPDSILDIGTGTGYVPRVVDAGLTYRPRWTLLDIDHDRLALATQLCRAEMLAETVEANVLDHRFQQPFDAVLATFTLLEIEDVDRLIAILPTLVQPAGLLLVTLPDAWHDVLEQTVNREKRVAEFLVGRTSVPKIDKFTLAAYPFKAVRIEHLISRILESGFSLSELAEAGDAQGNVYLLAFLRQDSQ